jgi:hypothetical protein
MRLAKVRSAMVMLSIARRIASGLATSHRTAAEKAAAAMAECSWTSSSRKRSGVPMGTTPTCQVCMRTSQRSITAYLCLCPARAHVCTIAACEVELLTVDTYAPACTIVLAADTTGPYGTESTASLPSICLCYVCKHVHDLQHMLSAGSEVGSESEGEEASGLAAGGQRPQVSFLTAVLMAVALTFHSLLEVCACHQLHIGAIRKHAHVRLHCCRAPCYRRMLQVLLLHADVHRRPALCSERLWVLQGAALGAQEDVVNSLHIFIAIQAHKGLAAYALGSSIVESDADISKVLGGTPLTAAVIMAASCTDDAHAYVGEAPWQGNAHLITLSKVHVA